MFKCKTWRHRISCGVMTCCLLSAKYSIREAQDNSVLGLFETLDDEVHLAYFDDVIPLGIVIEARLKKKVWVVQDELLLLEFSVSFVKKHLQTLENYAMNRTLANSTVLFCNSSKSLRMLA